MVDQIDILKQLQALDGELYRLKRQQRDKPKELEQVNARVAAQAARTKAAEDQLKALQLAQKEREVELQTREASVRKLQSQLFQLKTNKEYTTMQREIDSIKTDNSVLEETILKGFDAIDQAGKERQREQGALAETQTAQRAEQVRIEGEQAALGEQISRLEQGRSGLTPNVPREALTVYERILSIREGLALVPLLNDACGGCYRKMTPQVVNEVYLKAKLVTCESCNRILYFDEAHSKL